MPEIKRYDLLCDNGDCYVADRPDGSYLLASDISADALEHAITALTAASVSIFRHPKDAEAITHLSALLAAVKGERK